MKTATLLAVGLLTACSHDKATDAASGDGEARTAPYVARRAAAPPRWPEEYPTHFLHVPEGIAMTAGDDPSADHPAGTAYVLENRAGHLALAEWDLASGAVMRRRAVPFDPSDQGSRVLHDGDRVHLAARGAGTGDTYYALLDTSFHVLARTPIKKLGWTSATTLTSDAALALVVGMVPSYDGAGGYEGYVASFDAQGRVIAERELPYAQHESRVFEDCAAVVQGTPYLLRAQDGQLRLEQLTPNLKEVISTVVPIRPHVQWAQPTLWARGDRLVVDAAPVQFEFSPDLTQVREVPRRPPRAPRALEDGSECWQSTSLGPFYALLCSRYQATKPSVRLIAWDRQERGPI